MNPVTIRRGTIRVERRDGEVVRLPLAPEYEGDVGLPSHNAVNVLAHELTQIGESEADFDLDAVGEGLLAALVAFFQRRDEVEALGISGDGIELASHMLGQGKPDAQYIVPGLIAREQVTLISGREKLSGKSTLTAYLMGALERDEETVFGPALGYPVRTVWLTEEPDYSLFEKVERFRLGAGVLLARNYALGGGASFGEKLAVMEDVSEKFGAKLLVVDPFSRVAKVEDEAGTEPGRRAEEASDFAQRTSLAVVLIHHNRKSSGGAVEDSFRGSTSLTAAMDNIVQVDRVKKKPNVRKLTSWGRVDASNWVKEVELDGATYTGGPDEAGGDALLLDGPTTVKAFAERIGVAPDTARRRLKAMVEKGDAAVDESSEPYVYSPVLVQDA
jgi:hypothetical protein